MQLNTIQHEQVKSLVKKEYFRRISSILKTQLTSKHKIIAINTLAIPVVRYITRIVKWTQAEVLKMDTKTRKMLTTHRGFSKRSDVDRLYTKRCDGGRGLTSVHDCIQIEEVSINLYRHKSTRPILHKEVAEETSAKQARDAIQNQHRDNWRKKPLNGQYLQQLEEGIDTERTFSWLTKGGLTIEAEGFITAAQDQSLPTRSLLKIYNKVNSDRCRLCGKHAETVLNILCECPHLAQTQYLERHNQVARYVYWKIVHRYEAANETWHWTNHQPPRVLENESIKILWDCNIYTDMKISARRPDIVLINKSTKTGLIIDINCPHDARVCTNEIGKMEKYTDLKIELERVWGTSFEIVAVVIGCLGAVSKKISNHLAKLGIHHSEIHMLQRMVIWSSCRILRKYITQSGISSNC